MVFFTHQHIDNEKWQGKECRDPIIGNIGAVPKGLNTNNTRSYLFADVSDVYDHNRHLPDDDM